VTNAYIVSLGWGATGPRKIKGVEEAKRIKNVEGTRERNSIRGRKHTGETKRLIVPQLPFPNLLLLAQHSQKMKKNI
jgi:hypothetical protein